MSGLIVKIDPDDLSIEPVARLDSIIGMNNVIVIITILKVIPDHQRNEDNNDHDEQGWVQPPYS